MVSGDVGLESVKTRSDLAYQLVALRARSGLTVRELARRLDVPSATLGGYFSGRHLPGPAQLKLFRSLVKVCGVTSPTEIDLWTEALARARLASDGRTAKAPTPYRGLEPFREHDANLFFGREAAISELLGRLRAMAAMTGTACGVLAVIAPSGSGKSSLLQAGLLPAVRAGALGTPGGPWSCAVMAPGRVPALQLARCLASMGPGGTTAGGAGPGWTAVGETGPRPTGPGNRLLVVDQLEGLFAPDVDSGTADDLLGKLAHLGPATLVVLGLRADFCGAAACRPALLPVLRHATVLLGPMTEDEVRSAITEPAQQVGVAVEDALVDVLLSDLAAGGPRPACTAGALPLLSQALLATWKRAKRNHLTVADYRATGGLRGAVARSAENLYKDLSASGRRTARHIFLRLVTAGDGAPMTRRVVRRGDLDGTGTGPEGGTSVCDVLERFIAARLITASAGTGGPGTAISGTVEVSHDTVLSAWPRLAEWFDEEHGRSRPHGDPTGAPGPVAAPRKAPSVPSRTARVQVVADRTGAPGSGQHLRPTEPEMLPAGPARAALGQPSARRRTMPMKPVLACAAAFVVAASVLAGIALNARAEGSSTRDRAASRPVAISSWRRPALSSGCSWPWPPTVFPARSQPRREPDRCRGGRPGLPSPCQDRPCRPPGAGHVADQPVEQPGGPGPERPKASSLQGRKRLGAR
jgi:transcriptional regulator with XRE-family HTH domain